MRFLVCCITFALVSSARYPENEDSTDGEEQGSEAGLRVRQTFQSYGLGDVIPALPSEQLTIRFGSVEALLGNELCVYDTIQYPYIRFDGNPRSLYTLVCINPDIGFYLNPLNLYDYSFLICLVVNIRGEEVTSGDIVSWYKPAMPLPGTGPNRNVCLVYRQPRTIEITKEFQIDMLTNMYRFNMTALLRQNRLGSPIAGNFYLTRTPLCGSAPGGGSCDSQNNNSCNCCSA